MQRPNMRATNHLIRGAASAAMVLFLVAGGCVRGLEDVDQRTDALIRERSGLLGATASPSRVWGDVSGADDPAARRGTPGTLNPAAGDLKYDAADEKRDIDERLKSYSADSEGAMEMNLQASLRQAQRTSRELLTREETYFIAAIRVLSERHLWNPQLAAQVAATVTQTYGSELPTPTALNVVNSVGVTQRLPFGGQLAATYLFGLTDQLRGAATDSYVQTSQLILSGTIPLLRGAGDIARENLIQTERDLVYAARAFEDFRRSFLVDISQEYFNLVQTQQEIANETEALELVRRTEQRTAALVAAGRLAEFEKNIASNEVLSRTATLASLRERYILALDRFKVRLGLGLDQAVKLVPEEFSIPDPQVTPEEAGVLALQYRLDLQTQRDQVEDSRRAVRNARNGLLPDLSLNGSVTMGNNDSRTFGDATLINPQSNVATAGATLTIPLDRTVETYNLRIATIGAQAAERSFGQARDNVVVDARSAVRNIELARFSLQIQERSVQIAERRAEEQELKRDEVTAQQIVETAQALSRARNARDRARTDLQFAILDYLLRTGQLRVSRDGTLERLPGMGERK